MDNAIYRDKFLDRAKEIHSARDHGKTAVAERVIAAHIKKFPKATIVRVTPRGAIIEEYIGGSE